MEDYQIRALQLSFLPEREALEQFLHAHRLKLENDVECAFGIFSADETLLGCGCAAGKLLKCFAIDEALRGQNGLGALISRLCADRFAAGYADLFIITRPHNRELFSGCGFYPLAETEQALLLENRRDGAARFLSAVPAPPQGEENIGAVVMNCNPFTNGHLALIRRAAAECGFLYVFVVEEDRSVFPFRDRLRLVREGTAELANACVCPSGPYMISAMTFPTYFLKETEDPSVVQSELDITLFGKLIAPELRIRKRFAGQEPFDPVTRAYNETMRRLLPRFGVEFIEVPRAAQGGTPISASRVRRLLAESGVTDELLAQVPPCTGRYLRERFSRHGEKL